MPSPPSKFAPRGLLAAGLAVGLALLASCSEGPSSRADRHGILVLSLDGLRADHVGCLGGERPTTPVLDSLADEGVLFSSAMSAAPLLEPAHIGILTGSAPQLSRQFYSQDDGSARWQINPRVPHMAVEFLAAGYRTAAFIDEDTLSPSEGFSRGFQEYLRLDSELESERRAGRHGQHLEDWLQSLGRDDSWFAYMELSDLERSWTEPLAPWDTYFEASREGQRRYVPPVAITDGSFFGIPHSRWRGGSRSLGEYEASYDGHIRRLDAELGSILGRLGSLGLSESTTIVILGSYGVQLGENGLYMSSGMLSMADLHVPLVLRLRQGAPLAGRRVDHVVSLMDLAPTLLELEGLVQPAGMHGVSLVPFLGDRPRKEPLRGEVFASSARLGGYVVIGEHKVVEVLKPDESENWLWQLTWSGARDLPGDKRAMRFYDRLEQPFPGMTPYDRSRESPNPDFTRLYRAGEFWAAHVFEARGVLQRAGLWGKPVAPEMVEELLDLGYLGPER